MVLEAQARFMLVLFECIWPKHLQTTLSTCTMKVWRYHDDSPQLRILRLDACPEIDDQTILFFYIQAFLLPEKEVMEKIVFFLVSHPK